MNSANLNRCRECAHYEEAAIFELCKHSASIYIVAEKGGYHTIGHMRSIGSCRHDAVHFSPLPTRNAA